MSIESRLNKIEQQVSSGAVVNPEEIRTRLWDRLKHLIQDGRPEINNALTQIIDDAAEASWAGIKATSPEKYLDAIIYNIVRRLRRLAQAVPGLWPELLEERGETI